MEDISDDLLEEEPIRRTWIEPEGDGSDNVQTNEDDPFQPVRLAISDNVSHGIYCATSVSCSISLLA